LVASNERFSILPDRPPDELSDVSIHVLVL
jgi:hypothetical protein